ncbi:MAG: hypothetical protein HY716_03050 [Planctomycetes bacterium]|nr:hypothetical protein [Planctomycetota bacterium]
MERVKHFAVSFRSTWSALPWGIRACLVILAVLLALALSWGSRPIEPSGQVKIADASWTAGERARLLERLEACGIPRDVEAGAVYVPADRASEALRSWRDDGALEKDSRFRFVEESNFFGTRWQFDRRWLVELQNRLSDWIESMEPVRRARVHITEQAEARKLGWNRGAEASAAVMVELKPGATLLRANADAIRGLLTAAVSGLKPEAVTLTDRSGVLHRISGEAAPGIPGLRERERACAEEIERKALRVLPEGSRVSAVVRLAPEQKTAQESDVVCDAAILDGHEEGDPEGVEFISIAALVPFSHGASGAPEEEAERAEFVRQCAETVRRATGISDERAVSILLWPLGRMSAAREAPRAWPWIYLVAVPLVALAAVSFITVRRALAAASGVTVEDGSPVSSQAAPAAPDATLEDLRRSVGTSIASDPRAAAAALRKWLRA